MTVPVPESFLGQGKGGSKARETKVALGQGHGDPASQPPPHCSQPLLANEKKANSIPQKVSVCWCGDLGRQCRVKRHRQCWLSTAWAGADGMAGVALVLGRCFGPVSVTMMLAVKVMLDVVEFRAMALAVEMLLVTEALWYWCW